MTTAPANITSTAPKRIYLDLGDCAHLITADETFANFAGEVTWSADNATGCGIPYVRADLVAPTSPASGALPALPEPHGIPGFYDILGRQSLRYTADDMRAYALAALASREASPAPLAADDKMLLWNTHCLLENLLQDDRPVVNIPPAWASELQALADRCCIAFKRAPAAALASPQAAPDGFKLVPIEPTDEMLDAPLKDGRCCLPNADTDGIYKSMIASAPVAPAPAVSEGWKLVPIEPTPEMRAAISRQMGFQEKQWSFNPEAVYRDSLAAAPDHPALTHDADPLQGAANWIKQCLSPCTAYDIGGRLLIGYNRALRLFEGAAPAPVAPTPDDGCECANCANGMGKCQKVAPTPAQPSEDARDAARWRKLLAQDNEDFRFAVVKNPHFDVFETPEELEAAVDALPFEPEGEATPPALKEQQS